MVTTSRSEQEEELRMMKNDIDLTAISTAALSMMRREEREERECLREAGLMKGNCVFIYLDLRYETSDLGLRVI